MRSARLQRSGLPTLNDIRARIESHGRFEEQLLRARQSAAAVLRERFTTAIVVMLVACGTLAMFALDQRAPVCGGSSRKSVATRLSQC